MNRRGFITGLISFAAAAPAIVKASSLMPVKLIDWEAQEIIGWTIDLKEFSPGTVALLRKRIADAEAIIVQTSSHAFWGSSNARSLY